MQGASAEGVIKISQDTVESAVMQLIAEGVASLDSIKGCNETEIAEIEKMYGLKLPTIYREFLKRMGKDWLLSGWH